MNESRSKLMPLVSACFYVNAIVIYNDGKDSDQSVRYRLVERTKTWEWEEKQSLPAKDFAKQGR